MQKHRGNGIAAGTLCYMVWGVLPIYWKALDHVSSAEVITQRIFWCFVVMSITCAILHKDFLALFKQPRACRFLIPASLLITVNWSVYIFAVDIGHIIEASIGYYMNPLFVILLGIVFFKERLSALQQIAVVLCAIGVVAFTMNYGQFPWISVILAATFAAYGAVKKKGGYPAIEALTFESAVITPVMIVVFICLALLGGGVHAFDAFTAPDGWTTTALLVGAGPVTALPLVLFAKAANSIPLSMLGFLQYLSPTISLLIGVFVYGEAFTFAHGLCLACIWSGLALVAIDTVLAARKASH